MSLVSLRFLSVTVLTLAFSFALACGGSDDDENPPRDGDDARATVVSEITDGDNEETSLTDIEPDTAVVTIAGERFEFEFDTPFGSTCISAFDVVSGAGRGKDEADTRVDIEIPPKGYEDRQGYEDFIPEVQVRDDENRRTFQAGGNHEFLNPAPEDGESQIDSYESDGVAAVGTATFIDTRALSNWQFNNGPRPEPVKGTFEINCG